MHTPAQVVDAHAHVSLAEIESLVANQAGFAEFKALENRRFGIESWAETGRVVQARLARMTDIDVRLEYMDRTGVDMQLVSINPTQFHNWSEQSLATELYLAINEGVSTHCALRPDRLTGLGTVPLQFPELTVAALDHAVLHCGLKGIEICTFAPDPSGGVIDLSDSRLEPLWERAVELDALVFIHPMGSTLNERLDKWYLSNIIGQPAETTVAIAHLIFSGVFDRHPSLRVMAAHGGGYLPFAIGRSDHAWRVRQDAHSCDRAPSEYLSSILFDSVVHSPTELRTLVDAVGASQVLLGTDAPYDMGDEDPLATVASARMSATETSAIIGANAVRLGLAASHNRSIQN